MSYSTEYKFCLHVVMTSLVINVVRAIRPISEEKNSSQFYDYFSTPIILDVKTQLLPDILWWQCLWQIVPSQSANLSAIVQTLCVQSTTYSFTVQDFWKVGFPVSDNETFEGYDIEEEKGQSVKVMADIFGTLQRQQRVLIWVWKCENIYMFCSIT